jgi:ABC-2 type transport system permease protein
VSRTLAITVRVYRQLIRDRRFLALSVAAPLIIIFFLKVTLDALTPPGALDIGSAFVMPVVAAITFFLAYLLCCLSLVGERTHETLSRMFISGYGRGEIVAGYLLGFAGLATLQAVLTLVEANLIFTLHYALSKEISLFIVIWVLAIVSVGLGILFSNFARNEAQVLPFIPLVLLPSVFLSGILTRGVDHLPAWAQAISLFIPLRYAGDIIQGLIADRTMTDEWGSLLALLAYGVVLLGAATLTLREYD